MSIIISVSMILIVLISMYVINLMQPFIAYEKLNNISLKYMYIIEKYGYLTEKEKSNMLNELKSSGIDTSNVKISAPTSKMTYGKLIELRVEYKMEISLPSFGSNKYNNRNINLVVNKSSYSKI